MANKGALALAECIPQYAVDCTLMLYSQKAKREFVVRTSLDGIGVWKARNNVPMSPYSDKVQGVTKDAAIINGEIWIFGIDATKSTDVTTAVRIGMKYHQVGAKDIIGDVYVKNLNTELENELGSQALVTANKQLYRDVYTAVLDAAKLLGVSGVINFYVISSNKNWKIPKEDLHAALKEGGAQEVETDDHIIEIYSSNNAGLKALKIKQNLHLATVSI